MLRCELHDGAYLRLLEEGDADELFALGDRERDRLAQWLPWPPATRTRDDTLGFIRTTRRQVADNDGLTLAIVDRGAIAGIAGVHHVDWANRATTLGYWVAASSEGRGLVTAAVRALTDHAFRNWGLERVVLEAAVGNARSRAVARRLGFREEGVRRHAELVGGRFLDIVVHAVLADGWPAPPG